MLHTNPILHQNNFNFMWRLLWEFLGLEVSGLCVYTKCISAKWYVHGICIFGTYNRMWFKWTIRSWVVERESSDKMNSGTNINWFMSPFQFLNLYLLFLVIYFSWKTEINFLSHNSVNGSLLFNLLREPPTF